MSELSERALRTAAKARLALSENELAEIIDAAIRQSLAAETEDLRRERDGLKAQLSLPHVELADESGKSVLAPRASDHGSLESLAAYLERFGYRVQIGRMLSDEGRWMCELINTRFGFYPRGEGATALAAVQAACQHPKLRSVMGELNPARWPRTG